MIRLKNICLIGGEGIGIEVINSAKEILEELSLSKTEIIEAHAGQKAEKLIGSTFPKETKDAIDISDSVLFGATHKKAQGVLLYLRYGLDNFANIRPCKLYHGIISPLREPKAIDFIIVRENLEGLYSVINVGEWNIKKLVRKGILREEKYEKFFHKSTGYFATKIITKYGTQRIAKLACDKVVERKNLGYQGKLTIVHKSNVMPSTDGLFKKEAYSIAEEYIKNDGIIVNDFYVDDMARRLIRFPENQDIILTINEYGDILSDLAAELVGGLGLAPSGCIGGKIPYFEPVHGSAPDIAGQNIANPLAAILSLKMLLEFLEFKEASLLERAIEKYFILNEDIAKNWKFLPKDLVPKVYQEQKKYAKTTKITEKFINILRKL
ncbi:MAG: NAD-dependent isocitrate dehydrogenase [Candidatus Lokiarchaeota archaeon]|nr:NAD-dependent isocitrate dehydrogenase [Candidatus Lokiarchaeota archaeon]